MIEFAFKMCGALLVIVSALLIGNYMIFGYKKRIKELEALKKAMLLFRNEITYSSAALSECFHDIAARCTDMQIAQLFCSMSDMLSDSASQYSSVRSLWNAVLDGQQCGLHLSSEELQELRELGACLGCPDAKMQTDAIDMYISITDMSIENAAAQIAGKCRVTRVLSLACGLFICIMLL